MALTEQWLIEKADRKLGVRGMNKEVATKVRKVIRKLAGEGVYVCVAQAYRSNAEQNVLYAQGRTKPGNIVTNAKGGQSNHNYGVAVDLCLYTPYGDDVIWTTTGDFKKVVKAMKAEGFKWGGDWTSFKDYPHFELWDVVGGEKIGTTKKTKPASKAKASSKTINQLAQEVIAGKHGVGQQRKKSLGSKYEAVQARVNELLAKKKTKKKSKTISQLADEVIAGKHGTGRERKISLGSKYEAVQKEVNRRLLKK